VPTLSSFYGIVVRMYYDDHAPPHIHVMYGGDEALVALETLVVIRGRLPRRALALVLEWATLHRSELNQAWSRAEAHEPLDAIAPLD
jgi:hypothetical protein